jgi:anti-sigma B factor antagonist
MKLNVLERTESLVDMSCEGELAPLPSHLRPEPLADLLGPAPPGQTVLLDLSRTEYINSTGISWLIQAHKQLGKRGGRLVLHSPTPRVQEALDLVNLSGLFQVSRDRATALAQLDPTSTRP